MKWSDIEGWCNYGDLYEQVVNKFDGGTLVEVGVFLGRSLVFLADACIRSGKSFRVVGVDTFRGSGVEGPSGAVGDLHTGHLVNGTFAGKAHGNLIACGVGDVVDLLVCSSVRASTYFPDGGVEFVFIDARHTYEAVCEDIDHWLPKVRPGGWLAGHDYHPGVWDGVVRAVQEKLPGFTTISASSWAYEKK